jgi:hypothetical protein
MKGAKTEPINVILSLKYLLEDKQKEIKRETGDSPNINTPLIYYLGESPTFLKDVGQGVLLLQGIDLIKLLVKKE